MANKWGGLKVFSKFFDNMEALPHHIHLREQHAKNVGMDGGYNERLWYW